MNGWRGTWAAAQMTGVIFSSLVWIVVWGLSLRALAGALVVGAIAVAGRNSRPMLWWRFGARRANDLEREAILSALVPVALLRGRLQPSIWIGHQLGGGSLVIPTSTVLVVSREFLRRVVAGQLTDRQARAVVSEAMGLCRVLDSRMVNAIEAYCAPWRFVQILSPAFAQVATRHPILRLSWKVRWIVFGLAMVDAYRGARWAALVGVTMIAILSWTTGHFESWWLRRFRDLGDRCAVLVDR